MAQREDLQLLLSPAVKSAGYVLWGVEYLPQGKHSVLRVYIDHADGIGIEDCEAASRQISALLDVEDPIKGHYALEVSSPGLDRPLFQLEHYQQLQGQRAALKLLAPVDGVRSYKGVIESVRDDEITLMTEDKKVVVRFGNIQKAYLDPDFEK